MSRKVEISIARIRDPAQIGRCEQRWMDGWMDWWMDGLMDGKIVIR